MTDLSVIQRWLNTLDPSNFLNEDDVETKFVIPLFEYLGYPSTHRRGKYPIHPYNTDRSAKGRRPEIDQVYFSSNDQSNHNGDTSLVMVEVKKVSEIDLTDAIRQAKFYAAHINPVLLVVTNGLTIIILDNRKLRETNEVFSSSLEDLKHGKKLNSLYSLLNFHTLIKINEDISNEITHKEYVELERILMNQPEIREHLNKGDFNKGISQNGLKIIVSQPKVRIECTLPITYKDGSCKITFSSILLRELIITVDHETIVGNFLQGLGTSPHWKTRHFLDKQDNGYFLANLGKTMVNLSEIEAFDLCFCIDQIGNRYKQRIILNEDILNSWDYPIKRVYYDEFGYFIEGYHILSVDKWLWDLMHKFSIKYSMFNTDRTDDWHIFWDLDTIIRVRNNYIDNVWLHPVNKNLSVDIIYEDIGQHLPPKENIEWYQSVGPKGYWTLPYTEKWLINEFIPKVLDEYSDEYEDDGNTFRDAIYKGRNYQRGDINLVEKPIDLIPYMFDINQWINTYPQKYINSNILVSYYKNLSDLCIYLDKSQISLSYIISKLYTMSDYEYNNLNDINKNYNDIISDLKNQAERVANIEYELKDDADMMTRVFKSLLGHINENYPQDVFNALKNALNTLWQLARFELRHVARFSS